MSSRLPTVDEYNALSLSSDPDGYEPSEERDTPCEWCGEVEGDDGRLPWWEPSIRMVVHTCYVMDDSWRELSADGVYIYWCPPMPAHMAECAGCSARRWHHDLMTSHSNVTGEDGPVCRDCIRRSTARRSDLKDGAYSPMDCSCDDCFDTLWTKAGGRAKGGRRGRSGSGRKRRAASSHDTREAKAQKASETRRGAIRERLASGSASTDELVAITGASAPTVRSEAKAIGATYQKSGREGRWTLTTDS